MASARQLDTPIVLALLRHGADASSLYRNRFALTFLRKGGAFLVPDWAVPDVLHRDDLSVSDMSKVNQSYWEQMRLNNGKTPLMFWAANGVIDQVRVLLDQGADVNAVDDDGDGVLRWALASRNAPIFSMLLNSGADANAASTSAAGHPGSCILHAVAAIDWEEGVSLLVAYEADVNPRGADGATPLMVAAAAGSNTTVNILHAHGAEVNAVDNDGDSVLYYAASKGHVSTVSLLLRLGANADARPAESGHTPLTIAAVSCVPTGNNTLAPGTTVNDYTNIVFALLRAGADASLMYKTGFVLLRYTERGIEEAPLELVPRLVLGDDWAVAYKPAMRGGAGSRR